jgi:tryptophan 2,3-dioxygenase
VEAARRETTLRQALHAWLYRTPIQGSSAGDAGDGEAVTRFLACYFEAAQKHAAAQQVWLPERLGAEATAVEARLMEGLASARLFLEAGDAPEAERETARRVRAGLLFIESYRELPLLAWPRLLVDSIVELEEYLVLWRTRHARMVERTIGRRPGTGGSSGVDYLDQTAKTRIFTELWAVRTLLLPREYLPQLENTQSYGFAKA